MATIRLIPSTYSTGSTYVSVTNANNMYANTDSTNYATATTSRSGNTYVYIKGFNFNDVPSNAIIDSFSIKLKASMSGVSTSTNYRPILCNNTTAISNGSGSSVITTSVQTITFTGVTQSWDTIKGYGSNFGIRVNARRSNNSTTSYLYIYGAEIEVNYRLPIYHNVTSTLSTDRVDSISPEGLTSVLEGDDYILTIEASSIDDVKVEDNGTDVSHLLVRRENVTSGSVDAISNSFTTGLSASNANFYKSQNETGTSRLEYAVGYSAENPNSARNSDTGYTYVKDGRNNTATGWINYLFDFSSIPNNATIDSVQVKVYGARESTTTDSTHMAKLAVYSNNTLKGSEQEFTSTSNTIVTLSNIGTWTRQELQSANLRFTVAYYGGRIYGATWSVTYSVEGGGYDYYYEYTITNVSADHNVVVSDNVIIPPDEDPTKTYYSVNISSINATTTPPRGTSIIESGTSETITIYPTDPLLTLVTDNGVDISSQLVLHGGTSPTSSVTTAQGASYGFDYSASTGYYVSNNKGVDKSAAVCVVSFNLPVRCLVTIEFINYAEATYDFGVFGNIDSTLSNNYYAAGSGGATITDNDYKLACNTSTYNTSSVQTITYEIPSGQHSIYIKYSKDDETSSNNDTLQWKVSDIEELEVNNYYTYNLNNLSGDHSLIFIFGDVSYYFVNSSSNGNCKLYPNGQTVQLPGDVYRLTVVPNNSGDTVNVVDNNVDVTSLLERKEVTTTKQGVETTVVNYIYKIEDVEATHNIVASTYSPIQGCFGYIKRNGVWVQADIKIKNDNRWNNVTHTYGKIQGEWDDSTMMRTPFIGIIENLS